MAQNSKLRCIVVILAWLFVTAIPTSGQSAQGKATPSRLPSVDEILEKSVTATGGRAAWLQLTSMHIKAEVSMSPQGLTGTMELFSKAPDKESSCMRFEQGIFFCHIFDGKNGWQDDSKDGLKPSEGKALEEMRRDADFYAELHRKQHYKEMKVDRDDEFDSLKVFVISAIREDGQKQELYFAKDSGLCAGRKDFGNTPQESKTSFLEDYKLISGPPVKLPTKIRMVSDDASVRVIMEEILPNAEIPDSVFAKPAKSARDSEGVGKDDHPDNGKVTDGVYQNDFFGFQYRLPQGWMVHGEETQKVLMDTGKELLAGDDPTKRSMMDVASKRTYQLLTAFEYPFGTPGKENRSAQLLAEDVRFAPGIQTGKDYILILDKIMTGSQIKVQFEGEPSEERLDGTAFYRQSIVLNIASVTVYEIVYSTVLKHHALSWMFTAKTKEGVADAAHSMATFHKTAAATPTP